MDYVIAIVLLACSALFSGLTLGLMGLNVFSLKRKAALGNKRAAAIYAVRKHGNWLLTTLLLGNVAVNAGLAIFLGSIASGVVAGFAATALIFVLGEIIPQAVMSRHAMQYGAATAPIVRALMYVSAPVTYPIAWGLDKLLGEELPTFYTKKELMQIISEHEDSGQSAIDRDEERILHGALQFSNKQVDEVMTPSERVIMLETRQRVDDRLRKTIAGSGFSRYPVYRTNRNEIVGILYTKDVIVEPEHATVLDVCDQTYLKVRADEKLDTVMALMLSKNKHMAIVREDGDFAGVITLEDIIEEVIQREILDEDDHLIDTKRAVSEPTHD